MANFNEERCVKGWNYGKAQVNGENLNFDVDDKPCFKVPLSEVSNCTAAKSEAIVEFHLNEESPVSLMEMRFFMPFNPDSGDIEDPAEVLRQNIMKYADIGEDGSEHVTQLDNILFLTPRGRYDIKIFPTFLGLHGKTHNYKVQFKHITRMFLLPHRDEKRSFFIINVDPPMRQGQTRYPFLISEIFNDEHVELELNLTEEQIELYKGKLESTFSGSLKDAISRIFRSLANLKIIVPGISFSAATGPKSVACSFKTNPGYLFPLEKGFIYVHKPTVYIRYEEVNNVHFGRSEISTRTFDFEVLMNNGHSFVFSNMEKDVYNRLFEFVREKKLGIRNAHRLARSGYKEAASDEEIDRYKEELKAEAKEKGINPDMSDDTDSDDEDYNPDESSKRKASSDESSESEGSED